jgi:hypothetical protein
MICRGKIKKINTVLPIFKKFYKTHRNIKIESLFYLINSTISLNFTIYVSTGIKIYFNQGVGNLFYFLMIFSVLVCDSWVTITW